MTRHHSGKSKCKEDEPNCLNCPYPDCIATVEDINRQNRIQTEKERAKYMENRNKQILELHRQGVSAKTIGVQFNLSESRVIRILRSLQ